MVPYLRFNIANMARRIKFVFVLQILSVLLLSTHVLSVTSPCTCVQMVVIRHVCLVLPRQPAAWVIRWSNQIYRRRRVLAIQRHRIPPGFTEEQYALLLPYIVCGKQSYGNDEPMYGNEYDVFRTKERYYVSMVWFTSVNNLFTAPSQPEIIDGSPRNSIKAVVNLVGTSRWEFVLEETLSCMLSRTHYLNFQIWMLAEHRLRLDHEASGRRKMISRCFQLGRGFRDACVNVCQHLVLIWLLIPARKNPLYEKVLTEAETKFSDLSILLNEKIWRHVFLRLGYQRVRQMASSLYWFGRTH